MTYSYSSLPLTSGIAAKVILETVPVGTAVRRADLVRDIAEHHQANGGLPAVGSVTSVIKKALSTLAADGHAEQTAAKGYWRITAVPTDAGGETPVERGQGKEAVYVYYFPAYRDQAALHGTDVWPVKIGMTTSEVPQRLRDQIGTAMPEEPVVGLIYRTDAARDLERSIHSILKGRGKQIHGAPGKEWYSSSSMEVLDIIHFAQEGPAAASSK